MKRVSPMDTTTEVHVIGQEAKSIYQLDIETKTGKSNHNDMSML